MPNSDMTSESNNKSNNYVMYFDGCSKGNPGKAGAGAIIYENDNEIWSSGFFVGNNQTNNYAEYCGLIHGLEEAVKRDINCLTVKGDSLLVIKQMLGQYQVKSQNLQNLFQEAKNLEKNFEKIEFIHVLRKYNTVADHLSNIGLLTNI
jgi:ribonuclease HI